MLSASVAPEAATPSTSGVASVVAPGAVTVTTGAVPSTVKVRCAIVLRLPASSPCVATAV